MKRIQLTFTIGVITTALFTQVSLPVFAQDFGGNGLLKDVHHWMNQASQTAERKQDELQKIIHQADSMITMRLNSLNNMNSRIQNDKRLSSSQKNSLLSDIQTDISGLNALKTKTDADTNVTTVRNDEKQIITNYYIYARFEPKIRILITLNNLQSITANLQAIVPQIQNLVSTFQSQGKDVSQIQSFLNDLSSQLQTITTTLSNDVTTVQNISVATTNPQATFNQVRQDIAKIVQTGFGKVRSDFAQIRALFRQLIFNAPGSSISPSGTPTLSTPPSAVTTTPFISPISSTSSSPIPSQ